MRVAGVTSRITDTARKVRTTLKIGTARPRRQPSAHLALYPIAITQARVHEPARAYLEHKRAEGKSRREALRCLKRLLVRVVFQTLKASPALT